MSHYPSFESLVILPFRLREFQQQKKSKGAFLLRKCFPVHMKFTDLFPKCGCGEEVSDKPLRVSKALFMSTGDSLKYVKNLHSKEVGPTSNQSVQHWKISTSFNAITQVYAVKKQWYLGLPRMIHPSIVRIRSLLNSVPQDSLVSGALWILFELDVPDSIKHDVRTILVSLVVNMLRIDHPRLEIHPETVQYLSDVFLSRSVERYIADAKCFLRLGQPVQLSHIIIRSIAYKGLELLASPSAPLPPMKLMVTVCNARIGQLDQTYFTTLSPTGGIVPVNQSVNATDEIIVSVYVRSELLCRFQTVGFALIDPEKGPLKLYRDDLSDFELFREVDPTFFVEIFAECLQWMVQSEGGGTSIAHGTATFTEVNTMDDSEAIHNVAQRLQPQSGVQLSPEEKYAIVLSALPTYGFRPLDRHHGETDDEYTLRTQCQICLGDYEEGDQVRALPCMHAFHAPCAESWLRVRLHCPNCLADMVQLLANPTEPPSGQVSPVSAP